MKSCREDKVSKIVLSIFGDRSLPPSAAAFLRSKSLVLFAENLYPNFHSEEISLFVRLVELFMGPLVCPSFLNIPVIFYDIFDIDILQIQSRNLLASLESLKEMHSFLPTLTPSLLRSLSSPLSHDIISHLFLSRTH